MSGKLWRMNVASFKEIFRQFQINSTWNQGRLPTTRPLWLQYPSESKLCRGRLVCVVSSSTYVGNWEEGMSYRVRISQRSSRVRMARPVFPLVRIPYKYGFLKNISFCTDFCTDFFINTDFWTFVKIFFKKDHFYRFYSLILLFCKLCECDAICCELYDNKYQKNLVSILFSCFFKCKVAIQNDG